MTSRIIQRPEIMARLQRALHMKERGPAPTLLDTVVPVVLVEDVSRIDDNIQLSDQRPFGVKVVQGAVAGNFSFVRLVNPPAPTKGQEKLLIVDRVAVSCAVPWRAVLQAFGFATTTGMNRDSRYAPLQGSWGAFGQGSQAGDPAVEGPFAEFNQAVVAPVDVGVVVSSGFELLIYPNVVNNALTVTYFWREFDTIVK